MAGLEGAELELESLRLDYEAKVELARKAGEDIVALTDQYSKDVTAIAEAEAQKQKDIDKAVNSAKVGMAMQGLSLISELAGEGTQIAKVAGVAQATISGVQGVQNAFTTANLNPLTAIMPAYPYISAGLAGAFSALQIQKILSGSPAGGGGGGVYCGPAPAGAGGSGGGGAGVSGPSAATGGSGTANTGGGGGGNSYITPGGIAAGGGGGGSGIVIIRYKFQ